MPNAKTVRSVRHEKAEDGTIYWTLSFYLEPEKVASALGQSSRGQSSRGQSSRGQSSRLDAEVFRRLQSEDLPSRALRDAINPLFNDIADREIQGDVHDFLLAADADQKMDGVSADQVARGYLDLTFQLPDQLSWRTEGRRFTACPEGLGTRRDVRLRRFWMAHNNGALSYHLSFTHHYGMKPDWESHSPATYYFLASLQKLAAPKEYGLSAKAGADSTAERQASVFEAGLGIDPLDQMTVRSGAEDAEGRRFWAFVADQFEEDAERLFAKVAKQMNWRVTRAENWRSTLIDEVNFTEVPGLRLPKSRFMFFFRDSRFFDRLMPVDPSTETMVPRRTMVRTGCYSPYRDQVTHSDDQDGDGCRSLHLDADYWDWVKNRPDWSERLAKGQLKTKTPGGRVGTLRTQEDAQAAIRAGTAYFKSADSKVLQASDRLEIPAFEWRRYDCLDYMFLAGFNQNIIDFMNQDASEILDSTDPLYPSDEGEANERFFVRYANHRGMITYVPSSRSLEFGNDYIGTCPYAFLIHVLALHNEFLGRAHEARSLSAIEEINQLIDRRFYRFAEKRINEVKLDGFNHFERYRFDNPFRYDTEQKVFAELEDRRGISRKKAAIDAAVESLEDHTADLQNEVTKRSDARRDILLGGLGIYGAGQMIYWIGEKALGAEFDDKPRVLMNIYADNPIGTGLLFLVEGVVGLSTALFIACLGILGVGWLQRCRAERDYEKRRQM